MPCILLAQPTSTSYIFSAQLILQVSHIVQSHATSTSYILRSSYKYLVYSSLILLVRCIPSAYSTSASYTINSFYIYLVLWAACVIADVYEVLWAEWACIYIHRHTIRFNVPMVWHVVWKETHHRPPCVSTSKMLQLIWNYAWYFNCASVLNVSAMIIYLLLCKADQKVFCRFDPIVDESSIFTTETDCHVITPGSL